MSNSTGRSGSGISFLGNESLLEQLLSSIGDEGRQSVVIEGPAGSGKTFLAETIAAMCKNKFSSRWARGDRLERQIEERVLVVAGNQPLRRDVADYVADAVDDLGDLLAQDGVAFGRIAHRAVKHALAGGSRPRLSETQQRFLARLLTVDFGKRPLLIVDDLQFWDNKAIIGFDRYGRALGAVVPMEAVRMLAGLDSDVDEDMRNRIERAATALLAELATTGESDRDLVEVEAITEERRSASSEGPRSRNSGRRKYA